MSLAKFSLGIGDRFGREGLAQLKAIIRAKEKDGVLITPVWNKSNREHKIVNTSPKDVKSEADYATSNLEWMDSYYIDADHINFQNVDPFLTHSNYFTIDIAEFIGREAARNEIQNFITRYEKYCGKIKIVDYNFEFILKKSDLNKIAEKYLYAIQEASRIYQHILKTKESQDFITEISMDETEISQSPTELFGILALIHYFQIPINTIAPKFSGDFYKGVDYVGDIKQFTKEFEENLGILAFSIDEFNFSSHLKLSIHSGSDKFAIYEKIRPLLQKYDVGIHLKTAGTTWLEELIGLASAGISGLTMVKKIYKLAYDRYEELAAPYASVLDVNPANLPKPIDFEHWDANMIISALEHDQTNPNYDRNIRQFFHVSYKIAAELGDEFYEALHKYRKVIEKHVTDNLYERHIKNLFIFSS